MKNVIILVLLLLSFNLQTQTIKYEVPRIKVLKSVVTEEDFEKQRTRTGCYRTCQRILKRKGLKAERYLVTWLEDNSVFNSPLKVLDSMLNLTLPVIVGVHHTYNYGYNNGTTDHFVIIIEKNFDEKGVYYRYLDVGKYKGASKTNILRPKVFLENDRYIVSEVRKTINYERTRTIRKDGGAIPNSISRIRATS